MPTSAVTRVANAVTVDNSTWQEWWRHNRDALIDVAAAVRSRRAVTPGDDLMLEQTIERRPGVTEEVIYAQLVPVLKALLRDEDARVQRSVLMALARIGEDPGADAPLANELAAFLASPNQGVSEMAVVSLGVLGTRAAILTLTDVLRDTRSARALVGGGRVAIRHRALAAYALGIAGARLEDQTVSRYLIHNLAQVLEHDGERYEDLQAACVHAMGLVRLERAAPGADPGGRPSASLQAQVEHLLGLLEDKHSPDMVRIHAPTALARLAAGGSDETRAKVVEALLGRLADGREARDVQRTLVAALGLIGDCDADEIDTEIRKTLIAAARGRDHFTRSFALMALAEVATRPGTGAGAPWAGAAEVQQFLTLQLARGSSRVKPWAATALGLIGRGALEQGEALDPRSAAALEHLVRDVRSPSEASAYSLANGLARIIDAVDPVMHNLDKINDEGYRGDVALGLGMMGAMQGLDALRAIKDETDHQPFLKEQVTIARAMLGDRGLVPELVDGLDECGCLTSLHGNMKALAWVGDMQAVRALLAIIAEEDARGIERAVVVTALGRIADKDALPWESVLAHGVNYASAPPTLTEPVVGFGILDL